MNIVLVIVAIHDAPPSFQNHHTAIAHAFSVKVPFLASISRVSSFTNHMVVDPYKFKVKAQ